jgi:hypothetical protein
MYSSGKLPKTRGKQTEIHRLNTNGIRHRIIAFRHTKKKNVSALDIDGVSTYNRAAAPSHRRLAESSPFPLGQMENRWTKLLVGEFIVPFFTPHQSYFQNHFIICSISQDQIWRISTSPIQEQRMTKIFSSYKEGV